jgi:hypothetical protein
MENIFPGFSFKKFFLRRETNQLTLHEERFGVKGRI